jgi:ribosomal protein L37AE/L43A
MSINRKTNRRILTGSGISVRKAHTYYRNNAKKSYLCQYCHNLTLQRQFTGLWNCKVCHISVIGDAYNA